MFISEPKSIHDAVKPLIYFNCFIGLGAFRLPNLSDTVYLLMKLHTAMFTVLNLVMIYITFNVMDQVVDSNGISPMALTMYKIIISVNSCIAVMSPILLWLYRKVLRDCFRQMADLIDTFKSDLGTGYEYKKQYICLIYQITAIILVMVLMGVWETVITLNIGRLMNIRSVIIFCSVAQTLHHPLLVMLLLDVNFCTFVGYLGKMFRTINDNLLELKEERIISGPDKRRFIVSQQDKKDTTGNEVENTKAENFAKGKHHSLREIRRAHLGLCKLARRVNVAFGIQNLLSAAISFTIITGLLYTIYSALSWHNSMNSQLDEIISSCIWTAIYAFKIWLVNHSCWNVSNEAEKTGEVIYEVLDSQVDKELQCEIQEFGIQMLQNPVRFNACGFFSLHHSFIQGVIGSITTYLVILIQMSHASETSTYDTSLADNTTKISVD